MTAWGPAEKENWYKAQTIKRSYLEEEVPKIQRLSSSFEVLQYGALSLNPSKYPLFLMKNRNFDPKKSTVLVTGGVHGYETSGVQGALLFGNQCQELSGKIQYRLCSLYQSLGL